MYEFHGYLVEEGKLFTKNGSFYFDDENKILYFKKLNTFAALIGGSAGLVGGLIGGSIDEITKNKNIISFNLKTLKNIECFKCRLNKAIKLITNEFIIQIIPSNYKEVFDYFSKLIN